MNHLKFFNTLKKLTLTLAIFSILSQCADEELLTSSSQVTVSPTSSTLTATTASTCGCTYVVPASQRTIDGITLNIKPGAVICLDAAVKYGNLQFKNIVGTSSSPITIKNCGGTANIVATGASYGLKMWKSKYFRITGGSTSKVYGIKITGGQMGITLDYLSTNFEVDHVELATSGFAGLMAKTDPSCDNATIRGNFTMRNVSLHDNYVHDCGGEGLYVGNSFYMNGMKTSCGTRYPHAIEYVKIYNNIVKNAGWDGIQLGSATVGAEVYNNYIENYGAKNVANQRNGIQLGEGTGGKCYNNHIKFGTGNGMNVLGLGDNVIYNNIIQNAGGNGIFCDERYTPGNGFKFINNTILNPKYDGIRLYAEKVPMNVIINNIIVNPGSYSTYTYPRTSNDAYVYKLGSSVRVELSNNYFTRSITAVKFADATGSNFRLTQYSPAVNKGKSISTYSISKDFYDTNRLNGTTYDIGADEY